MAIDLRQTKEYTKYLTEIGWKFERIGDVNYSMKHLPLLGSLIKLQRPEKIGAAEMKTVYELAKRYRAFQIVIEPSSSASLPLLVKNGFKISKSPYLNTKTIHIDITKSEEVLLKEMHHKTRYNIKVAKRNDITIAQSADIDLFCDLWHQSARERKNYFNQSREMKALYNAFGKNAYILFSYTESIKSEPHGGILLIVAGEIAFYMHAGYLNVGKKLYAPTLCTWASIQLAKEKGVKIFDFEGIYDERFPSPSWQGFTRFKKSFGGKEIEFPGTFQKLRLPL